MGGAQTRARKTASRASRTRALSSRQAVRGIRRTCLPSLSKVRSWTVSASTRPGQLVLDPVDLHHQRVRVELRVEVLGSGRPPSHPLARGLRQPPPPHLPRDVELANRLHPAGELQHDGLQLAPEPVPLHPLHDLRQLARPTQPLLPGQDQHVRRLLRSHRPQRGAHRTHRRLGVSESSRHQVVGPRRRLSCGATPLPGRAVERSVVDRDRLPAGALPPAYAQLGQH